ncbi:MAG: hypothetical protein ACK2TV_04290, partial [Anaerolineales bacterium]
ISFPVPTKGNKGTYVCIGRTKLADLAIVGVTVLAYPKDQNASGYVFKIALSSVAPTVIVLEDVSNVLSEGSIDTSNLEKVANLARAKCKPIDDIRASQEYRREMVYRLTLHALNQICDALLGENER